MHCVSCVTIGLIRLRFEQCSFVDGLFINGCSFCGSNTLRMTTRRLSVMLFVFSFQVTVTSCYLLRGVPGVAEEFLFTSARRRVNCTTFHSLLLIILLPHLHRLSTNLTTRAYIRVVILTVFLIILYNFIICQFAALFPLVTSQA